MVLYEAFEKRRTIRDFSTSLRAGSNSDMLADQFIEGARSAGNEVNDIMAKVLEADEMGKQV